MDAFAADLAAADLARRQHGVLTRRQALEVGFTSRMVERRAASGRWLTLERGLYALPGNPPTWERQCMAASLKTGGVVSGVAAGSIHCMPGCRPGRIEIAVPTASRARTRLAVVRRTDAIEMTRRLRIPVTTVADTVVRLAAKLDGRRLERLVDHLIAADGRVLPDLQERYVAVAGSRLPGTARLRAILAERGDGYVPPASELEARLLDVYGRCPDAPEATRQAPFPWQPGGPERVDLFVPAWRAILEADGRRWHTRLRDFEVDRTRDNAAVVRGYRPLRFTWHELTRRPANVLAALKQLAALCTAAEARSTLIA